MFDINKADEIYKKRLERDPDYNHKLVLEWREDMPQQFARKMHEDEYGCHIMDDELYDCATSYLKWTDDRGKGAKWTIDDIKKLSNVDFDSKRYTLYDYAYVGNMLYSDYCNVFTEPSYYLKMAKAYLEDPDYMGDPSERAYKDAMKRIKYFKDKV